MSVPDLGTGWLALTVLPPLLVAIVLLAPATVQPRGDRALRLSAVAAAVVSLVGTVGLLVDRPSVDVSWIDSLGVRFSLGVDGISAPLLLLTGLALLVAVLVEHHPSSADPHAADRTAPMPQEPRRATQGQASYAACLLLVGTGALLTFLARDAVLFFIGFETVLVPMWLLVARHGDPARAAARDGAALRFLLVTVTGSTFMLLGILVIATSTGTTDLQQWAQLAGSSMSGSTQLAAALLLLVGLGFKVPVWPLHTWLPWVHATAPTAGSVLLAAVLLKMGTYGIVRLVVAGVPDGLTTVAPVLAAFAVTGIVWAGLACLVERDLKRLIAWSSVAHLGFVVLGIASGTETGLQAALFGNVAHGVIAALLFVVVGALKQRWGSADLATARAALRETSPVLGLGLVVGIAAAMGLPGLAGFWGEVGAVYAAWSPAPDRPEGWMRAFAVVAALGAVLAVAYGVRVLREVWSGNRVEPAVAHTTGTERLLLVLLPAVLLVLGVYPQPLLELTEPVVQAVMNR